MVTQGPTASAHHADDAQALPATLRRSKDTCRTCSSVDRCGCAFCGRAAEPQTCGCTPCDSPHHNAKARATSPCHHATHCTRSAPRDIHLAGTVTMRTAALGARAGTIAPLVAVRPLLQRLHCGETRAPPAVQHRRVPTLSLLLSPLCGQLVRRAFLLPERARVVRRGGKSDSQRGGRGGRGCVRACARGCSES